MVAKRQPLFRPLDADASLLNAIPSQFRKK